MEMKIEPLGYKQCSDFNSGLESVIKTQQLIGLYTDVQCLVCMLYFNKMLKQDKTKQKLNINTKF